MRLRTVPTSKQRNHLAINALKWRKAAGLDSLPAAIINAAPPIAVDLPLPVGRETWEYRDLSQNVEEGDDR